MTSVLLNMRAKGGWCRNLGLGVLVIGFSLGAAIGVADACEGGIACDPQGQPSPASGEYQVTNQGVNQKEQINETDASIHGQIPYTTTQALPGGAPKLIHGHYTVSTPAFFDPTQVVAPTCDSLVYDSPIDIAAEDAQTPANRQVTWKRPWAAQDGVFPTYVNFRWFDGERVANDPSVNRIRGDDGYTYVQTIPDGGAPTGTGLQDMNNAMVLVGQNLIYVEYQGDCVYKPGPLEVKPVLDALGGIVHDPAGNPVTSLQTNFWIADVVHWGLKDQRLKVASHACIASEGYDACFNDPLLKTIAYTLVVPAPPSADVVVPRTDLVARVKREFTAAGSLNSHPDPLWQLVEVPTDFFVTGMPQAKPVKYFEAGIPSLDPSLPGRAVEYKFKFKIGLDSVTWLVTNTDTGKISTFDNQPVPALDPASGTVPGDSPWFTHTFVTAGHYRVTAIEHYSVSVWVYYFACYPGCMVDVTGGFQPYPGGGFDLTALVNGNPYLPVQVGQVEGIPVTPAN
ncbi:MAG: hypothetical protein ACYDGR_03250 [Candidatus Dormibacteria bacterium]